MDGDPVEGRGSATEAVLAVCGEVLRVLTEVRRQTARAEQAGDAGAVRELRLLGEQNEAALDRLLALVRVERAA